MQLPTTKSLHRLSIENPWFAVNPLFWTSQHLRLLDCHFQHLDSALPPSSSSSIAADKNLIMHSRRLAKMNSPIVKSISVGHLLRCQDSPLEKVDGSPPFTFAGRAVHSPDCDVFQVSTTSTQQRPIVGYYHYDKVTRERQRVLRPRLHPGDGCNYPVSKMYQRKLRTVTPSLWFEDSYLVCVLLSLAQLQWRKPRKPRTPRPKAFSARLLVTNKSDTTLAHIFQADIPYELLEALNHPTLDMESFVWPTIQHIQVPFEPYASFAKRIIVQLVGYEYSSAVKPQPEVVQRGEKRKRDESDVVGQRRSVKSWDSMQPAAVSMANR
ncbi:hypothetical protein FOPG_15978 [Fusarium oxysporum f. sp. conglutinans race 2 54008]|nr:hypothetical protein FOPG_15978 [Fusarium oxysporum f. sp. conglutinans race 2 54008]KAG6978627.1 hypothetical protein FocnCong_v011790 [Fusarium oxysporum f. sp. conglutinans]KAI8397325.1 hypothetical protein FOFC_20597 [Fusarium oxysporum]